MLMIRHALCSSIVALAIACAGAASARAEIIDRVLAVVDGQVITLSDARAALQFALIPADVSLDPIRAAMQRLIDRHLLLDEVERYAAPDPPPAEIEAALNAIQAKYQDPLAFEIALNQTSMSREELRRFLRDTIRIEAYMRQRFATAVQISEDELVRYYREHQPEFMAGGKPRPFEEVREQIRAALAVTQREAFVQQWLEGLRRRGAVQVVYLPGR